MQTAENFINPSKITSEKLSDYYELLMNKINNLHAITELGSIADFEITLEPYTYTQIFILLEDIASQIKSLVLELEKSFFK